MAKSTKSAKGKSAAKGIADEPIKSQTAPKDQISDDTDLSDVNAKGDKAIPEAKAKTSESDQSKKVTEDTADPAQTKNADAGKDDATKGDKKETDADVSADKILTEDIAPDENSEDPSSTPIVAITSSETETTGQTRGSVFPMLLGGVAAAVIGYGAAQIMPQGWPLMEAQDDTAELREALSQQNREIASMREEIAAFNQTPPPDTDGLSERIAAIGDQVSAFGDRLSELELRPDQVGVASDVTDGLQSRIVDLQAQIEALAGVGATRLDTAKQTLLRAATTRIDAALDSGEAFADALREIVDNSDVTVPEVLTGPSTSGVATEAELRQSFPAAARAAIAAETEAMIASGEVSRLSGFVRQQLGMRSLSPIEGQGADAVLSRAEAALDAGDLSTSLTELETLPDVAAPAMQDWIAMAQKRLAALNGAAELNAAMNSN